MEMTVTRTDVRKIDPSMISKMGYGEYTRARNKKARIYIFPKGETLLDNLENRRSRPYNLYRKQVIPTVLKAMGLPEDTKVRWSQYAGCSMCPCSPGFIIDSERGTEVFVNVE